MAEGAPSREARRQVRYFPRWLYRVGIGSLVFALIALLLTVFNPFLVAGVGGIMVSFLLLIVAGLSAVLGCCIILIAQFGPWPLQPLS